MKTYEIPTYIKSNMRRWKILETQTVHVKAILTLTLPG